MLEKCRLYCMGLTESVYVGSSGDVFLPSRHYCCMQKVLQSRKVSMCNMLPSAAEASSALTD